jgi:hypothetical protein
MTNIIIKLRDAIEDNYKYTTDSFEYLTSKIFGLSESNIDSTSLLCYKNGVAFLAVTPSPTPVTNWVYNSNTGKITVITSLVAGDVLEFIYNAYSKYSDSELRGYIRAALGDLSIEKYKTFVAKSDNTIYPTPTEDEEYLISFIASVRIKGSISSYKTPEITINFNDKQSKEDKIRQAIRQFSKVFGVIDYVELDAKIAPEEEEDE